MIGGGGHGNSVARWSMRWALVRWPSGQLPEPRWLAAYHALVSKVVVKGPSATLHLHWQTCRITNKPNLTTAMRPWWLHQFWGFTGLIFINLEDLRSCVQFFFISKSNSNRFARSSPAASGKTRAMMAGLPLLNAQRTAQAVVACTSSLCRTLRALHETPIHFSIIISLSST